MSETNDPTDPLPVPVHCINTPRPVPTMLHGIAMVDHHTVCIEVSQVRVFHERTRLAFLPLLLLPTAVSVGSSQSIAQLRYKLYCIEIPYCTLTAVNTTGAPLRFGAAPRSSTARRVSRTRCLQSTSAQTAHPSRRESRQAFLHFGA